MYIDISYFWGEREIPQIGDATIQSLVNRYIAKYEPVLLEELLGVDFPISTGIRTGGLYFDHNGKQKRWIGLVNTNKQSIIANYVYCQYLKNAVSITTGSGEKKAKNASSDNVTNYEKIRRAWNEMVTWNIQLLEYIAYEQVGYTTIDSLQTLIEVFDPIQFKIGDGGLYTPLANTSKFEHPALLQVAGNKIQVFRNNYGFLFFGVHRVDITNPTAGMGGFQLADNDVFDAGEEFTVQRLPLTTQVEVVINHNNRHHHRKHKVNVLSPMSAL